MYIGGFWGAGCDPQNEELLLFPAEAIFCPIWLDKPWAFSRACLCCFFLVVPVARFDGPAVRRLPPKKK